ncbi:PREDICTED: amphiregulin [Miniopterus natalensis]|uniref:amphiregulin n=1 Tax=Miniopterus natalensis TaxID=291302 RepID=UPI0007A6BADC|nr:PREDICTED: amphiregulin [Miniopterus natalensis]
MCTVSTLRESLLSWHGAGRGAPSGQGDTQNSAFFSPSQEKSSSGVVSASNLVKASSARHSLGPAFTHCAAVEPTPSRRVASSPEALFSKIVQSKFLYQQKGIWSEAALSLRLPDLPRTGVRPAPLAKLPRAFPVKPAWLAGEKGPGLYLCSLVLSPIAHYAAGSAGNDTFSGKGEPFSGDHGADEFEVTSRSEMSLGSETSLVSEMPSDSELSSEVDYDYAEDYEIETQISGYLVDDSVRVEQVVKPKENKTESENTTDKPKRKKKGHKNKKNRKNRKKNPCDTKFQNFCIHGECRYIENLKRVTCNCHQDYSGERCGGKSMKTHSAVDGDLSKIMLVVITAFVSAVSFAVVAAVIAIQLRKRYFREYEGEAEEQTKLRQENGNAHAVA